MKIAIMQPYFFPYIGYFQLINLVDKFILFDTPQYIRHGWIERNRILKLDGKPMYIKTPLKKHSQKTSINNIYINNKEKWQNKLITQLSHYKKYSPFYNDIIELLKKLFTIQYTTIVELNFMSLKIVCDYLDIKTPIEIYSNLNLQITDVKEPDEWALYIAKRLRADTYINSQGGMEFFNKEKYIKNEIDLKFLFSKEIKYKQFYKYSFSNLSIIDVMMFNSVEKVKEMLNKYQLK